MVENDNLFLISLLQNNSLVISGIGDVINDILSLSKQFDNISWLHVCWSCNQVAHYLVVLAFGEEPMILFNELPFDVNCW